MKFTVYAVTKSLDQVLHLQLDGVRPGYAPTANALQVKVSGQQKSLGC